MVGRGIGHQQPVGARFHRTRRRPRLPDVAADVESEHHPAAGEHAGGIAAVEHALLVEHGMVGQVVLAIHRLDLAAAQQRRGVEQAIVAAFWVAYDQRESRGCIGSQLTDGRRARRCEIAPQHQVFGGIAADRHLGGEQQIGTGGVCFLRRSQQARRVAGDVTDGEIDLGDAEFHRVGFIAPRAPAAPLHPGPPGLLRQRRQRLPARGSWRRPCRRRRR